MELERLKQLIKNNETEAAICGLDDFILVNPTSDEAYFLRGNAYRKRGDFRQALNNYLKAIELNPESPAKEAHKMLMDILNFYNKNLYNP